MYFIFDVDGTLTPSRGKINSDFEKYFIQFISKYPVALVTGSDLGKTIEQLGQQIIKAVDYSFNCSGNAIYQGNTLIKTSEWTVPEDLREYLFEVLSNSKYKFRYGNHLEQRIGMLNFSVVGRDAVGVQRKHYYEWDLKHNERQKLCEHINKNWKNVCAVVGGETGIDIFERGKDKSQILDVIKQKDLHFFGDRMDSVGNDYPLGKRIIDENRGKIYHVKDWKDTWSRLKFYEDAGYIN